MLMAVTQPFKEEKPLLCHVREHLVTDGTSHIFRLNVIIHNVALYVLMSVFLHNGGNSRTIQSYKKGKTKDCLIHTNELLSRAFFECV